MIFFNRLDEMKRLNEAEKKNKKLIAMIGRRRVGKSRLLQHWSQQTKERIYVQSIESTAELQVEQLWFDLKNDLKSSIKPKSMEELLEILSLGLKSCKTLIIDEFSYLVAEDRSLPSRLQRRIDKGLPFMLILSGSSQSMMESQFLNDEAPLYQRADEFIYLKAMDYKAFAEALHFNPQLSNTFELFSLIGGIPKYWEWLKDLETEDIIKAAQALFFDPSALMNYEPTQLMQDENLYSIRMKAVLDCIGHGDVRPSQMASRMGVKQQSLSVPLSLLTKCGLTQRLIPFGHSTKNPKIVEYQLSDSALRFWFETYLVHLNRWRHYSMEEKKKLIHIHASKEFENYVISQKQATRFWNKDHELDGVRLNPKTKELEIFEVKWTLLTDKEKEKIKNKCLAKAQACFPDNKYFKIEVIDASFLLSGIEFML